MRMKGRHGHRGHHGHHGPHHGFHGHHGPHHGPHDEHDGHYGPHHKKHFKLNSHYCKPNHKMLKRLHKCHHQHHAWKLHCSHSGSSIPQQVNVCNPEMTKHFGRHCKSGFSHFRRRCCEEKTANVADKGPHHRRCSSLPPTVSLENDAQL